MKQQILISFFVLLCSSSIWAQYNSTTPFMPAPKANIENMGINTPKQAAPPLFAGSLEEALTHAFDSIVALSPIKGFTAAVLMPDGTVWKKASGVSQELPSSLPLTTDHLMGMGSISKSFVAVTLLKMVDAGLLSLDDKISKYLDPYPNINGEATVRQVLSHRTGFNDYINENPAMNTALVQNLDSIWEIDTILHHYVLAPNFPLNTDWSYSNTNFLLAGRLIEKISGKTWYEAVREQVLTPLGLTHTFAYPFETPGAQPFAHCFSDQDGDNVVDDFQGVGIPDVGLFSLATSAGCFITTPEDLVRFSERVHGGHVLNASTLAAMQTDFFQQPSSGIAYGLGAMQYTTLGIENWGHNGSLIYNSNAFYFPTENMAIAVQQNDERLWSPAAQIVDGDIVFVTLILAYLDYKQATATHENNLDVQTIISPNPGNGQFNILSSGLEQDQVEVSVVNALGATVVFQQFPVVNQQLNAQIDLSTQASGVYYVQVRDAHNVRAVQKVMLRK